MGASECLKYAEILIKPVNEWINHKCEQVGCTQHS